jgi:UDP-glucose 4-epimerase
LKKKILITGAFGYVGGRLAVHLNRQSFSIKLGTRLKRTIPSWLPEAEISIIDLFDIESIEKAVEDVFAVIHLSALNEIDSLKDPKEAILINTIGTYNLLNVCISKGIEQFIYFSTAHVYGSPLKGHITEDTLTKPIHPYSITHRSSEDFVFASNQQGKIKGIVVRLSNSFGAPISPDVNRWTLLVNDLCKQLVEKRQMTLLTSGIQKRDFITLDDVNRAVVHLISLPKFIIGDGIFNLGGRNTMSIIEMAEKIKIRCKIILGFDPIIHSQLQNKNEIILDLNYDCSKLSKTNFIWHNRIDEEIDSTLIMCKNTYRDKI